MASAREINILVSAKDQASGVLGGISGKLQSLAGAGVKAAAVGIAGLGAGLLAAGGAGLKFNSDMENVQAQLMGFVKDGDKVNQMLADLRSEAATTPFSFGEMAEAMVSLTPAAKQSGQDVMALIEQAEILAALNPAEGMVGGAFALKEALSGDFTSIVERFNLPRQRLNELKEQGVPAVEAVNTVLNEMGADISLVDNLSKTLSGRWSTIQDTLMGLAATATKPIFDQLSNGLGKLGDFLSANEPRITAFAELIGGKLAAGLDFLKFAVENVIDGFQFTEDDGPINFFESFGLALQKVANFMTGTAIPAIQSFFGFLQQHSGTIATIAGAIGIAVGVFATLSGIIGTVSGIIGGLVGAWGAVSAAVGGAGTVIGGIVAILGGPVTIAIAAIAAAAALLAVAWTQNWGDIQGKVQAAWGFVQPILQSIATRLGEFGASILPELAAAWESAKSKVLSVVQFIWTGIVQPTFAAIAGFLEAHGDTIRSVLGGAWETIKGVIDGALKIVSNIIRLALDIIQGDWRGAWEDIKGIVSGAKGIIVSVLGGLKDAIVGIFSAAGSWLLQAGKDLIQGLINGITGMWGSVVGMARRLADTVVSTIKGALQIASPSKVLRWIGHMLMAGLTGGIDDKMLDLAKKAAEVASTVVDSLSKALDFATKAGKAGSLPSGINELISSLKFMAEHAVQSLGDTGRFIGTELLDAAKAAGEAMESVFGALGAGLEFAQAAAEVLNGDVDIMDDRTARLISTLKFWGEHAVQSLGDTARLLGEEAVKAAKSAAEAFDAVFSALGSALTFAGDAAKALDGDVDILDDRTLNLIGGLAHIAEHATAALLEAATLFIEDSLDAAKVAGEAMGAPFGVLTAALDFVDRAAESVAIQAGVTFGEPLIQTLVGIAVMATQAMSEAATRFETEVLEATAKAAESMGKPFGVLSDALGFASDVIDFLADNKWPNVSSQLIGLLTDLAVRSVQAFSEAATRFSTDVLESASAFADAAGPVFDTIKKVADGFTSLQEMGKVSEDKLGLFEGNIERVMGLVRRMRSMAESGITDATVFRNLMDQIAAALKVGTETLGGAQAKASSGSSNVIPLTPMARGGIVTRPTPALVGEAGPEAIIPLNRAGQLAWAPGMGGGGQQTIEITVPVILDGREIARVTAPHVVDWMGRDYMRRAPRR